MTKPSLSLATRKILAHIMHRVVQCVAGIARREAEFVAGFVIIEVPEVLSHFDRVRLSGEVSYHWRNSESITCAPAIASFEGRAMRRRLQRILDSGLQLAYCLAPSNYGLVLRVSALA